MIRILFVCTGNICRSPTAEGIFRKFVEDQNLSAKFEIDSAGLLDYHEGDGPDPRTQAHALKRGYDLSKIRSRPITQEDFENFDYLIAMDDSHLKAMEGLCPNKFQGEKVIQLMLDYSKNKKGQGVPDPYYSGEKGFEHVLDLLEESCEELLNHFRTKL